MCSGTRIVYNKSLCVASGNFKNMGFLCIAIVYDNVCRKISIVVGFNKVSGYMVGLMPGNVIVSEGIIKNVVIKT